MHLYMHITYYSMDHSPSEESTSSQLVKKFHPFCGSIYTFPYPEPNRSSPCTHIPLPEDPSSCYPSIYAWVFQVVSFP